MPKRNAAIASIVTGLLLSITLPGCAHRPADRVEVPVAIEARPLPPAELLRCADRPPGLPEDPDLVAQIPTAIRAGILRLAPAFAARAQALDRLAEWLAPGSCPPAIPPAPAPGP